MKYIQGLKVLFAVFSLVLISGVAASAQTGGKQTVSCSRTSDASIARAINNRIQKVKAGNPGKKMAISVRVKNKVVTFSTKTPKNRLHQNVMGYAKNIRCVKSVKLNNPGCSSVGCPKNTYACGGNCIPCIEVCFP